MVLAGLFGFSFFAYVERTSIGVAADRMMSEVAGPAPLDVLDVGCGTGFLSLLLAALETKVTPEV